MTLAQRWVNVNAPHRNSDYYNDSVISRVFLDLHFCRHVHPVVVQSCLRRLNNDCETEDRTYWMRTIARSFLALYRSWIFMRGINLSPPLDRSVRYGYCWQFDGRSAGVLENRWLCPLSVNMAWKPRCTLSGAVRPPVSLQQTRDIEPLLVQCWASVYDAGPTLNQQWLNVSCLLRGLLLYPPPTHTLVRENREMYL